MADLGLGFGAFVQNMARNIHMPGTGIDPNKVFTLMADMRMKRALMETMIKRANIMAGASSAAANARARATYAANLAEQNLTPGQRSQKMKVFDDTLAGRYTSDPVVKTVPKKGFDFSGIMKWFGDRLGNKWQQNAGAPNQGMTQGMNDVSGGEGNPFTSLQNFSNTFNSDMGNMLGGAKSFWLDPSADNNSNTYNANVLAPMVAKGKKK